MRMESRSISGIALLVLMKHSGFRLVLSCGLRKGLGVSKPARGRRITVGPVRSMQSAG